MFFFRIGQNARNNIISHMRAKKKHSLPPEKIGTPKKREIILFRTCARKKKHSQPARIWAREKKTFPAARDQCARKKIPSLLAGISAREKKYLPGRPGVGCRAKKNPWPTSGTQCQPGLRRLPNVLDRACGAAKCIGNSLQSIQNVLNWACGASQKWKKH